jgi:hypothetical protein
MKGFSARRERIESDKDFRNSSESGPGLSVMIQLVAPGFGRRHMMTRTVLLAVAAIAVGGSAQAHHEYSLYLEDRTVSIEGALAQFAYRSPHTIVTLKTADSETYRAQWWDRRQLASVGVTGNTLRVGDRIVVTGSPGRHPGDRILHVKGVRRIADGWRWPAS